MGIFDKIQFWKKDNDMDLAAPLDMPDTMSSVDQNYGQDMQHNTMDQYAPPMSQQGFQPQEPQAEPMPHDPSFSTQQQMGAYGPQFQQQPQQQEHEGVHPRDVELILSKLETLKESVDHLATKVDHLEKRDKKYW
jgi:hypothetical protein